MHDEAESAAAIELQIERLRDLLTTNPGGHAEEIRETYSELLDTCADDPVMTARLKPFGHRINELTAEGILPRAFVIRGSSRR